MIGRWVMVALWIVVCIGISMAAVPPQEGYTLKQVCLWTVWFVTGLAIGLDWRRDGAGDY